MGEGFSRVGPAAVLLWHQDKERRFHHSSCLRRATGSRSYPSRSGSTGWGVRSCRRPGCHLAQYKRKASITKTLSPGGNGRKHPPARARRPFPRTGLRRGGGPRVEEIGREGAAIISRKQAWQRRIWVIARRCHVRDLLCLHQELNVLPRRRSCIIHQGA
jgi:hypothetical protein